jgi:hypothetical protein
LRGGAFNNNPLNLRSADRNRNAPANRNNNNGFRPASTLRWALAFVRPESAGRLTCGACRGAKSRSSPCVAPFSDGPAEGSVWPGGSGRPHGSKAPPGRVVGGVGLDQRGHHHRPFASVWEFARHATGRASAMTSPPPPKCSEPVAPAADALTRCSNSGRETSDDRPRNDVPSVCP